MSGRADPPLLLLAGGKGTRLRSLESSRPKPMVLVGGRPFLHWLVAHYARHGCGEFLVSTGYLAEVVESYPWSREFPGATFRFHRESEPLGTGGAVKAIFAAEPALASAWVVNGDTLLPVPLPEPDAEADALYLALDAQQLFDATPNLAVEGARVVAEGPGGQVFDAGAVWVTRAAVERHAEPGPCSLHELLAPSMRAGRVRHRVVPGTCYDIGTPERFRRFEAWLKDAGG